MSKEEVQDRRAQLAELLAEEGLHLTNKTDRHFNRRLAIRLGEKQLFLDQLAKVLADAFKPGKLHFKLPTLKKSTGKVQRINQLVLSDNHYGIDLDPKEVGHSYGPVEEARRLGSVVKGASEYKLDHRNEAVLYAHVIGDMIQNQLHDPRDGLPLAEQITQALHNLIQGFVYLAAAYPRGVKIFTATGNHGRNTARHKDRATLQKWDSLETVLYYALKMALAPLKNVEVLIGKSPYYEFPVFGRCGMGTHGDTVLNVGFPNKAINVKGIAAQINSINNSRIVDGLVPFSLFLTGHVHTGSMVHLPGKVTVVTNGALVPTDSYAQSIGFLGDSNGQWIIESVPDHMVGDSRFLTVDFATDKDKSLDSIIKPYPGF